MLYFQYFWIYLLVIGNKFNHSHWVIAAGRMRLPKQAIFIVLLTIKLLVLPTKGIAQETDYAFEDPPYNMHGILDGKPFRVHIADNLSETYEDYYYFLDDKLVRPLVPQNIPKDLPEVFDIWREDQNGKTISYFFITTFPSELDVKGFQVKLPQKIKYNFILYHVLTIYGELNNRKIKMLLEYTGEEGAGSWFYSGYYFYLDQPKKIAIFGKATKAGIEEITEEEDGEFSGFFEFGKKDMVEGVVPIIWHSADGLKNYKGELRF
ncbi:MAG TPA: hypothetical protein DCM08_09385 [Microscillaceae bacterium]|nr:hypothetical protein [Microscillaceae bacterium]